jgi:hypothetical protein
MRQKKGCSQLSVCDYKNIRIFLTCLNMCLEKLFFLKYSLHTDLRGLSVEGLYALNAKGETAFHDFMNSPCRHKNQSVLHW